MKAIIFFIACLFFAPAFGDIDLDQYLSVNINEVENAICEQPLPAAGEMEMSSFDIKLTTTGTFGLSTANPLTFTKPSGGGKPIDITISVSPSLDLVFAPKKAN